MLTLSGALLSDYQSCERRVVLSREWMPARWRPKALFDHVLRRAIFEMSCLPETHIESPAGVAAIAVEEFIRGCTDPGLDIIGDPYTAAKDWVAMIETITRCLGRLVLLKLHTVQPVLLDPDTRWTPSSWADDSGELHRWITVSEWNQDALVRELHGWHAFGDMAVLGLPMTIHSIHIGSMRNNRRSSTWARGWRHPVMNKLRFRQTNGEPFRGWRATYLADQSPARWDDWADQIQAEGAAQVLIQHTRVNAPSEAVCADTMRQIRTEAAALRFLNEAQTPFHVLPMSRSACDGLIPCPWQYACYSDRPDDTSRFHGIYRSRENQYTPGVKA